MCSRSKLLHRAFAAILGDGSVVTWGDADFGGDSSAVQDQLRDVQQIQASAAAFAAILGDGSVVTWGDADFGGDSSAVQEQLRDVQQIQASHYVHLLQSWAMDLWSPGAMPALVATAVRYRISCEMCSRSKLLIRAFAAILGDGSVVTWGRCPPWWRQQCGTGSAARCAADPSFCPGAFAAILGDGSVVTWGHAGYGGDSSAVQDQLRDVPHFASF